MNNIHGTTRRSVLAGVAGALGIAAVIALAGCAAPRPVLVPSDDDATPVVTVRAYDNYYEPAEVEIKAGEAVKWEFMGPAEHDVVSDDRSFVSELAVKHEYTHVFDEAGDFAYLCSIHPEMRGLVKVKE
ncbi:cupredoxin domain-containing protein [Leucobacter insecticola]|uniref:cupredoxin domain-containing protein n=1 Tax=Leucobacter insecticola TaxID=2714934 RepID=UPI001FCAACA1|nr:cupredoxin domain-containing protein [Leucobacter insecticola]